MACGIKLAKTILVVVNVAFLIIGAAIAGIGGYALSQGLRFLAIVPHKGLLLATISGGGLMVFSAIGCAGLSVFFSCSRTSLILFYFSFAAAYHHRRCFLFLYALLIVAVVAVELVAGVVIATFLNLMANTTITQSGISNKALSVAERDLQIALNETYMFCCVNNPTAQACSWINQVSPGCKIGIGLNSDSLKGLQMFKNNIEHYINHNYKSFGYALIALSVMELLSLVSACHLACTKPEAKVNLLAYQHAGTVAVPYGQVGQPVYA